MPLVVNLSDAKQRALPKDGWHDAVVHHAEQVESSKGNQMLAVQWKLTDVDENEVQTIVFDNWMLETAGLNRTLFILDLIGGVEWGPEYVKDGRPTRDPKGITLEADDLVGQEFQIKTVRTPYKTREGKDAVRPEVKGVRKAGNSLAADLSDE